MINILYVKWGHRILKEKLELIYFSNPKKYHLSVLHLVLLHLNPF